MINPTFLKTYIDLVETGSFTKTAARLNMTQPGVTNHLRSLEEYFDVTLVSRSKGQFDLTEPGEKLLNYSRHLFEAHDELMVQISTDDPHSGACYFSAPGSFGAEFYSFLISLSKKFASLKMHFSAMPAEQVIQSVLDGQTVVGFSTIDPKHDLLKSVPLEKEKLCLVAPKKFSFEGFKSLCGLGFINHPDGMQMGERVLSKAFPKEFKGMNQFQIKGYNNQISRILDPVAAGLGFTVLPQYACKSFGRQNLIQFLKLKGQVQDQIFQISKKNLTLPKRYSFVIQEFFNFKR